LKRGNNEVIIVERTSYKITTEDEGWKKVYKYNFHTHTSDVSPCGNVSAEIVVREHKEAGYQGIAITDHCWPGFVDPRRGDPWRKTYEFFKSGYAAAKAEGDKIGLDVFFAMELRFDENYNDYLVFGLSDEFVLANKNLSELTLATFREKTKDLDVLIFQAHPFRNMMKLMPAKLLDGVEIFNANERHDSRNHLAEAFAKEHNLIGISGSDYHELHDISRGGILTDVRIKNEKDLNRILRARDFEVILK